MYWISHFWVLCCVIMDSAQNILAILIFAEFASLRSQEG